uniref:CTCK domain-containing protein n=1 Tax=Panagrolaimus sp. JU765 TaxID=591449 RepID=A0AC34PX70_9BILA
MEPPRQSATRQGSSAQSDPNSGQLSSIMPVLMLLSAFKCPRFLPQNVLFALICVSLFFSTGYCGTLKPSCRVVGHEELIDVAGCDLVVVKVNKCQGYCTSFSFFHPIDNNKLTMLAKCCRMTEVKKVSVNLTCKEGDREIVIPSAVGCSCFDCGVDRL